MSQVIEQIAELQLKWFKAFPVQIKFLKYSSVTNFVFIEISEFPF